MSDILRCSILIARCMGMVDTEQYHSVHLHNLVNPIGYAEDNPDAWLKLYPTMRVKRVVPFTNSYELHRFDPSGFWERFGEPERRTNRLVVFPASIRVETRFFGYLCSADAFRPK